MIIKLNPLSAEPGVEFNSQKVGLQIFQGMKKAGIECLVVKTMESMLFHFKGTKEQLQAVGFFFKKHFLPRLLKPNSKDRWELDRVLMKAQTKEKKERPLVVLPNANQINKFRK